MTQPATEPAPAAPAEPAAAPGAEENRIHSLDSLNQKIDALASVVARLVPGSHADAQQRVEQRLDRPSTVEEQVQAELARARQEEAEKTAREQREADFTSVKETVAKLTEKTPEPPVRRATKFLGWS